MIITKLSEHEIMANNLQLNAKKVYSKQEAEIVIVSLEKGRTIEKHPMPVDVIFYILEGNGIIEIGEEKADIEKNDLIEAPKIIPHGITNTGDRDLMFMVIKTPRP